MKDLKRCPLGVAIEQAKRQGKRLCNDCKIKIQKKKL
jgi:hypothetical protein